MDAEFIKWPHLERLEDEDDGSDLWVDVDEDVEEEEDSAEAAESENGK